MSGLILMVLVIAGLFFLITRSGHGSGGSHGGHGGCCGGHGGHSQHGEDETSLSHQKMGKSAKPVKSQSGCH